MKRRILSILLSLIMTLSVVPAAVLGNESESFDLIDGSEAERAEWLEYMENNQLDTQDLHGEEFDLVTSNIVSMTATASSVTSPSALSVSTRSIQTFANTNDVKRYTVLVLDRSGSMSGTPLTALKKASIKFCDSVLKADGENFVAVVIYGSSASIACNFTDDFTTLQNAINRITYSGSTNINQGLEYADDLLSAVVDAPGTVKNILLLSDGMPNVGAYTSSGKYTYSDYYSYQYANAVYNTATSLKNKDYYIYTLGFFHSLYGSELAFARRFMNDLQNAGYYDVVDPEDLEFVFGEIADEIVNKKMGTFMFPSASEKDFSATYFYDDEYFSKDASEYNPSLATMSLCFELSAWGSNVDGTADYSNKSRNAKSLLKQIGFKESDIETNYNFTVKPSEDSMGVVVGHKDIKVNGETYTLIALATRGGGYEAEWAGNFTIGASGQHEGFKKASDEAYRFLADYINRHKDDFQTDIKLWFTGYSRAGATVNLLSGRLNDEKQIAGIAIDMEDLYTYCFEPPMGGLLSNVSPVRNYTNIHNILNPNDLVPKVAPRAWGFYRYGVDKLLPTALTSQNYKAQAEAMLVKFKALDTDWVHESLINNQKQHIVDSFQAKKIDPSIKVDLGHWEQKTGWFGVKYWVWVPNFQVDARLIANDNKDMSAFLDDVILSLSVGIGNRQNYTSKLQSAVRLAAAQFMGGGYEKYKWDKVPDIFDKKLNDHIFDIAVAFIWSGLDGVETLITEYLYDSITEAGIDLEAYASIPGALAEALKDVVRTVVASLAISGGNDLITLGSNASKLFPAHYPELCLAWLQTQDENYTPDGEAQFIINSYRVVRINCPVDVSVYDSNGVLVAQIINDVPQELAGSTIIASFNANGEKIIYLPADESYSIRITAVRDGELNYTVNEFSYDTGSYAKIVNYYGITIVSGDVLNGYVPKFFSGDTDYTGDGSSIKYTLSNSSGELTPANELLGLSAQDALYTVYSESNNAEGGTTIGGGVYSEGAFAQVTAIAYEKCEFAGWYDNNVLISTEAVYRFRVEQDVTLTARFNGNRPHPTTSGTYLLTIKAGTGGSISTGANGNYSDGSITPLSAAPNSGYRFVNWTTSNGGTLADANSAGTTFTMPANETTVTANFTYIGSNDNGGSSDSSSDSSSNTQSQTAKSIDEIILDQLKQGIDPIVSMSDTSMTILGSTLLKVLEANKTLTINRGIASLVLTPDNIEEMNPGKNEKAVIKLAQAATALKTDVSQIDELNSQLLKYFYNITISVGGNKLEVFNTPLTIRFNMSGLKLTDAQKNKLTGVRYLNEEGYNQLGGRFISKDLFEFKTSKLSRYGVLISNTLISIVTTIDKSAYTVNGNTKTTDVAPMIIDDRTMVPIRFIAEAFGAEVQWMAEARGVVIKLDEKTLNMTIGVKAQGMDVAPVIVNDRTMVPLRYISEQLDANVIWNSESRSIDIYR